MVHFSRVPGVLFTLTFTLMLGQGGGPIRAQDALPFDTVLEPEVQPAEPQTQPRTAGSQITATEPLSPHLTKGWIGLPVDELVEELVNYGWLVMTETPSLVQLDRYNQSLDLHVNRSRRTVIEVEVISP